MSTKGFLILLILFGIFSCGEKGETRDLKSVSDLDLQKYSGIWYEIARLPNDFENELQCVTANYSLQENGTLKILNKGFDKVKKKYRTVKGRAEVQDTLYPGRLKVSFFLSLSGDYYVIQKDTDYQYALVGSPSREYLWILSRTLMTDQQKIARFTLLANKLGFDTDKLEFVAHDCN